MKKQFWLGSLNTAILIGFILLVVSALAYFIKNETAVAIFFGILTILSVTATINFSTANEKAITFYSFLFIPHRFRYDEIFTMNYLSHPGKPQFSLLIFHLKLLKNWSQKACCCRYLLNLHLKRLEYWNNLN